MYCRRHGQFDIGRRRLAAVKRAMQTPVGQRCTRGYLRDRRRASPLPLAIASRNQAHRLVKLKQTTVKLSEVIQKQLTGARAFRRGAVWRSLSNGTHACA